MSWLHSPSSGCRGTKKSPPPPVPTPVHTTTPQIPHSPWPCSVTCKSSRYVPPIHLRRLESLAGIHSLCCRSWDGNKHDAHRVPFWHYHHKPLGKMASSLAKTKTLIKLPKYAAARRCSGLFLNSKKDKGNFHDIKNPIGSALFAWLKVYKKVNSIRLYECRTLSG